MNLFYFSNFTQTSAMLAKVFEYAIIRCIDYSLFLIYFREDHKRCSDEIRICGFTKLSDWLKIVKLWPI